MNQLSLASGFERGTKRTRKQVFLEEMLAVVPWDALVALVAPHAPPGTTGRPPYPVLVMLRVHFLQQWFALADEAVEDALHDIAAFRAFVGIDPGVTGIPDATTVLRFRHLLERHDLATALLATVNRVLEERGLLLRRGTAVDATIVAAPSSTKNKDQERDPEMHQTAKGKQWYFGMKAHVAVDSRTKLIHTILASAANVSDTLALPHLLHGKETRVYGDQGYQGQTAVIRAVAPNARDFTNRKYRWPSGRIDEVVKAKNRTKSKVRAKVEHVIGVIKRVFGFQKTRYRGLAKNLHRLEVMAALTNIFIQRRRLLAR